MSHENFDIQQMMEAARAMQEGMQQAQEELSKTKHTGESAQGRFKIEMMGTYKVTQTTIDPSLLNESPSVLESAVTEGVNKAIEKIEQTSKSQLSDLTSQFGGQMGQLPGHDD